jgi:hypothetical protein
LYDLIKPGQFDGILLSADLAHGTSLEDIKKFLPCTFESTPIASFAIPAEGVSSFHGG